MVMNVELSTKDAINYAGSKAKLARLLGITRQAVQLWETQVPEKSALKLYLLSNQEIGKLHRD